MVSRSELHHPHKPAYDELLAQVKARALSKANRDSSVAVESMYAVSPEDKNKQCGALPCVGQMDVGFFFDGTGNNKDKDYGPESNPFPFLKRRHSNVVRLYHAFPDEDDKNPYRRTIDTADRIYRYYIPGVGTPFPKVGDDEDGLLWGVKSGLGAGFGKGGEARIVWAMVQLINAMLRFYNKPVIPDDQVKGIVEEAASIDDTPEVVARANSAIARRYTTSFHDGKRNNIFWGLLETWIKPLLDAKQKPALGRVNIHVFGFSRGAAEARTFVNYLRALADEVQGKTDVDAEAAKKLFGPRGFTLLGIPVYIQFLGILDTVASVGAAGMWSFIEGHMGWADNTQEIPEIVGKCVHMAAAHEMRACFPMDSVRIEHAYIGNIEEIVYPGAHSDLGGGYNLCALGKNDLGKNEQGEEEDWQISRVPGFDMYVRAKAAGVPFYTLEELEADPDLGKLRANNLLPNPKVIEAMKEYDMLTGMIGGPVEDQMRGHAGLYLGWRWSQGKHYFMRAETVEEDIKTQEKKVAYIRERRDELNKKAGSAEKKSGWGFLGRNTEKDMVEQARIKKERDALAKTLAAQEKELAELKARRAQYAAGEGRYYSDEVRRACAAETRAVKKKQEDTGDDAEKLEKTQRQIINVVARQCRLIEQMIDLMKAGQRIESTALSEFSDLEKKTLADVQAQREQGNTMGIAHRLKNLGKAFVRTSATVTYYAYKIHADTGKAIIDELAVNLDEKAATARDALKYLEKWRQALKDFGLPIEYDVYAPERDGLRLLESLERWDGLPEETKKTLGRFFADYVHDSEAGFVMPEYAFNLRGIAKFRSVYFGDEGDDFLRQRVKEENAARKRAAAGRLPKPAAAAAA
jgi:hypothetical protein